MSGAAMPSSNIYPLHRPELLATLASGDAAISAAMGPPQVFPPGHMLVSEGEPSDLVFRIHSGWAVRSRTIGSGKRQIICLFVPHDLAAIKSMLLERQPDAIECMTNVAVQAIDQATLYRLAATNHAVAVRLMFQLGEDERRLHNWVAALGKADAEQRIAT